MLNGLAPFWIGKSQVIPYFNPRMAAMFYAFVFDVTPGFNSIDQLCDKLHHFQFVSKDEPVDDIYGHTQGLI